MNNTPDTAQPELSKKLRAMASDLLLIIIFLCLGIVGAVLASIIKGDGGAVGIVICLIGILLMMHVPYKRAKQLCREFPVIQNTEEEEN